MKSKHLWLFAFSLLSALLLFDNSARAANTDVKYNYQSPTYIPTARAPAYSMSTTGDYTVTAQNFGVATLRITGTCTSLAGTVQITNDNTNWTDVPITPVAGGSPVTSFDAAGFWRFDASGASKVRAHVTALSAACSLSIAGTNTSPDVNLTVSNDPCQDPNFVKSSVKIDTASSTTASLVAAATGKSVYVCGFTFAAVGTNPTATFKYGTTTTNPCDTGATALTGDINPSATVGMVSVSPGSTVFATPAAKQLCITTGATTDVDGVLTYVQK